jgi:hypothetical protein
MLIELPAANIASATILLQTAHHFNALFGMVAFNKCYLLIIECECFFRFRKAGHIVANHIFYVELDQENTVYNCESLLDCDVPAPEKHLVWEQKDGDKQLDGIAWGPMVSVANLGGVVPTVARMFDDDDRIGIHFELYILDIEELLNKLVWTKESNNDALLESWIIAGKQHQRCWNRIIIGW